MHEKSTLLPKFCEINARFTTNGYLLTQLGSQALSEVTSLQNQFKKNASIKKIATLDGVVAEFEKMFDLNKPIGILLGREVSVLNHLDKRTN